MKKLLYPTPRTVLTWGILLLIGYGAFHLGKYLLARARMFQIREVVITGNRYLEEAEIRKLAAINTEQGLFQVDVTEVTNRLLENKYIRGATVSRVPPSTILIDIQERTPLLYLIDGSIYMVDENGIILKKLPQMPMGKIPIITGLHVAELLQDRTPLFRAMNFVRKIRQVDGDLLTVVSEIHYDRGVPRLLLVRGGAQVEVGDRQHYQRLYLLSELFKHSPVLMQLPSVRRIDLRFAHRIIVAKK